MARLSEEHYKALGQETPKSSAMNRLTRVFRKGGSRKSLSPLPDTVESSPASSGSPGPSPYEPKNNLVKASQNGSTKLEKKTEQVDPAVDKKATNEEYPPALLTCRYLRPDGTVAVEDVYQRISEVMPKESAHQTSELTEDLSRNFSLQLFFHDSDDDQAGHLCTADFAYSTSTYRSDDVHGHFFVSRGLGSSQTEKPKDIAAGNTDSKIRKVNILKEIAQRLLRAYRAEPEQLTLGPWVSTNVVATARLHKGCLILLLLSTLLFTWLHPRLAVFLVVVVGPILWNYDVIAWMKSKERSMEEVLAFEDKARKWLLTEPIMCLSQEVLEGVDWKGFKFYLGHLIGSFVQSIPEQLDRAYGFGAVVEGYKATQRNVKPKKE